RRGDRTVTLVGAKTGKLGAERLAPQNRIAAIAGMTEIECMCHLRHEAGNELGIAPVTVAGEDQSLAADALAYAVAAHNLNAPHAAIDLGEQPVGDALGQDDDTASFRGMAQTVDQLPARARRQAMHAQGRMARIIEAVDQLEWQRVSVGEPFNQRSRAA